MFTLQRHMFILSVSVLMRREEKYFKVTIINVHDVVLLTVGFNF